MLRRTLSNKGIKLSKKIICTLILVSVCGTTFATAETSLPLKDKNKVKIEQDFKQGNYTNPRENNYKVISQDLNKKGIKPTKGVEISLTPDQIKDSNSKHPVLEKGIGGKNESVLVWNDRNDWYEWEVEVPQDGLYEIYTEYYPMPGTGNTIQRGILIDGKAPFYESMNIPFNRMWKDEGKPLINSEGDEIRPKQMEDPKWKTQVFSDVNGLYSEPLKFHFTKGKHTVRLVYVDQPMAISKLCIKSPKQSLTYNDKLKEYKEKGYKNSSKSKKVQGEDATIKSDSTVRREYSGDPVMEPASNEKIKLNMIGGVRWRKGNQEINWDIDVPESGLYKLTFRVGQWYGDGLPIYRQIAIDGEIPFKEMEAYPFEYKKEWYTESLKDSKGNPYLFYLEKGKHTLSMAVKTGETRNIIQNIENDSWMLSDLIRKIIVVTGGEPDPNFDYELDKKIPKLMDDFKVLSNDLQKSIDDISKLASRRPVVLNSFVILKKQVDEMIKNPFVIPKNLKDLISAQSSLTLTLQELQQQPLNIDYFIMASPEEKDRQYNSNFFQRAKVTWCNFIQSFHKDYDNVENAYVKDKEVKVDKYIDVWVARGKEWAELVKQKADEDFTPKTGIGVRVNMLPAGQMGASGVNALTLSIVSGKAPDVALGVDHLSPVELAIRNASVDISKLDGFNEVQKRFLPGIMTPFKYQNGVYALPETMDFSLLFYRKDIVDELKVPVPDTWESLYRSVLPILNQNGMQFFYPPLTSSAFLPFLYQNGGQFYTKDDMKSALDGGAAYKGFTEWTRLFTVYQFPIQADFFNRFRTGEMPMGVADYNTYMKILVAAPELYGRWGIANVPGKKQEDGTIDRTAGGKPSSAVILNQSQKQKESWEFLKWWTSNDIQRQFGSEIEATVGIEARWNTANINAFKNISWDKNDIAVMEEQWKWLKEQPVVLGGYFTDRHIKNAATSVIMEGLNERDALEKAVKEINKEMRNKQDEYGLTSEKK